MDANAEFIAAAVFLLIAVVATICTVYIWYVFLQDIRRPRGWLLWAIALACTMIDIMAAWFGYLSLRRLLAMPLIDWSPPVSLGIVAIAEMVPIFLAFVFWRRRRTHHGHPPPFDPDND